MTRTATTKSERLSVPCPGGIIPVARLRTAAEFAQVAGDGTVHVGQRQNLLLPTSKPFAEARAFQGMAGLVIEPEAEAAPNMISSAVAVGLGPGTPWLDEGVFLETLEEIDLRPPFSVSLIDPQQRLVPAVMSFLTLLAAPLPEHWAVMVQLPTGRMLLPCWIASDGIRDMLLAIERAWRGPATEPADIAEAIYRKMGTHLPQGNALAGARGEVVCEYEGFHPMAGGADCWLGAFNGDKPFPASFLIDLCVLAGRHGVGSIYLTPRRSLVMKHVPRVAEAECRALFARHGISMRHAEYDLNWLLDDGDALGNEFKQSLHAVLGDAGVARGAVEIGVGAHVELTPGALVVVPTMAKRLLPAAFGAARFALWVRGGADSIDKPSYFAEGLTAAQLALRITETLRQQLQPRAAEQKLAAPQPQKRVHQCAECMTVYDAALGDETAGVAPGTAFADLPRDWRCPLCDSPREAFAEVRAPGSAVLAA